jgi:hypothetical protein
MPHRVLRTAAAAGVVLVVVGGPVGGWAKTTICHKVNGRGNTGNGFDLISIGNVGGHANHGGDLIPAPNGLCLTLPPATTPPPTAPPTAPPTTPAPTAPPTTSQPPSGTNRPRPPVPPPTATTGPAQATSTTLFVPGGMLVATR